MGIDSERCELQVQQANTERDRVTKVSARECNSLAWQLLQLNNKKTTEAAFLNDKVRDLEVDKVALLQARKEGDSPYPHLNPNPNSHPIPTQSRVRWG